MATVPKKRPTEKQLLNAIDKYRKALYDSKVISDRDFNRMQMALYGAKCIIWDAFGSPRKKEAAWTR